MKLNARSTIIMNILLVQIACSTATSRCNYDEHWNTVNLLNQWDPRSYKYNGVEHLVYESIDNNEGKPPIILLHELPGLSEETLNYAQTLTPYFSVYVPLLFGSVNMHNFFYGALLYLINSEWHPAEKRPIHEWTRQLSKEILKNHATSQMGVIGMCLTGVLPLALLDNPKITSVVLSQPTLPLISLFDSSKTSLDLSEKEYCVARNRVNTGEVKILGLRFQKDSIAKRGKLKTLKAEFPDAYIDLEICSNEYQKYCIKSDAHSVLVGEWNSEQKDDHPVNIRRRQVVEFFKYRLKNDRTVQLPTGNNCPNPNDDVDQMITSSRAVLCP